MAVSILTNPKALKKVGIVVGSILLAILMPIIAIVSFFTGNFTIDTSGIQQKIEASLTAEQKAQMAETEKILKNVESELKKKKCSDEQILQARVITVVILHDKVSDKDFVTKLANCFKKDQKTNTLISNINRTFGTTVEVEDFEMLMNAIGKLDIYYDEFMSWADEFDLSTNEERKMIICKLIKQIRLYKGYQFEIDFDSDYKRFLKEFTMAS